MQAKGKFISRFQDYQYLVTDGKDWMGEGWAQVKAPHPFLSIYRLLTKLDKLWQSCWNVTCDPTHILLSFWNLPFKGSLLPMGLLTVSGLCKHLNYLVDKDRSLPKIWWWNWKLHVRKNDHEWSRRSWFHKPSTFFWGERIFRSVV